MRICELRDKEVINICSGRRLGCVADVEINIHCGEVEAIVIPGPGKLGGFFGTDCEYVIPFGCIRRLARILFLLKYRRKVFAKVLDVVYNEGSLRKGGKDYAMSILWKP